MPVDFPIDGDPSETEPYWSVEEVAEILHVSSSYVRNRCQHAQWPRLRVAGRYWLNAAHIRRAMELMADGPDVIPDHADRPRRLGSVDESEGPLG